MLDKPFVEVRHNIEVAHRLFQSPGKCENIHGHSMWVELRLYGIGISKAGIMLDYDDLPLEFGNVKFAFREYLDTEYDHHLLLNASDPWAGQVLELGPDEHVGNTLPGLKPLPGDPTTENIAKWIAEWSTDCFRCDTHVIVRETSVNAASAISHFKLH